MTTFKDYNIHPQLSQSLEKLHITVPTPIQALALPKAFEGRDILASAQTGSGKTIAYLLPILQGLLNSKTDTALILVPTRELAIQARSTIIEILGKNSPLHTTTLIGGESISQQLWQLKNNPAIIIGTPGRVNDHINRKSLKFSFSHLKYLVLDEVDRMLDIGFAEQLEIILQHLPKERQTFMFSATMPKYIMDIARQYLNDPEKISVDGDNKPGAQIQQSAIKVAANEKFALLKEELVNKEGSVIIFVKTKLGAEKLTDWLDAQGHNVDTLHGNLHQRARTRVIQAFRDFKFRILVATDVASRGLDVPHIQYVINFDLPDSIEDYIHRIGRTGRAGAIGYAVSFVSPDQYNKWRPINRAFQISNFAEDASPKTGARFNRSADKKHRSYR